MSPYSVIREKTGQNYQEDSIFFKKNPIGFIDPNEMKYIMHKNCQDTIWAVINCSLGFSILHRTRKEGQNSSFSIHCVFNSIIGNTRKSRTKPSFPPGRWFFPKNFLWPHVQTNVFWIAQEISVNLLAPLQLQIDDYNTWRIEKTWAKNFFLRKCSLFLKP